MKIYGAGRATSKPSNGTKIQDFFFLIQDFLMQKQ